MSWVGKINSGDRSFLSKSKNVFFNCSTPASTALSGDLPSFFNDFMMPVFDFVTCSATCAAVQLPGPGISLICVSPNAEIISINSEVVLSRAVNNSSVFTFSVIMKLIVVIEPVFDLNEWFQAASSLQGKSSLCQFYTIQQPLWFCQHDHLPSYRGIYLLYNQSCHANQQGLRPGIHPSQ